MQYFLGLCVIVGIEQFDRKMKIKILDGIKVLCNRWHFHHFNKYAKCLFDYALNMRNLTKNIAEFFGLLWVLHISSRLTHSYRYEPNTLTLQNFTECRGDAKNLVHSNFSITQIARNECKVNGELIFDAYYTGPLEVSP